MAVFKRRVLDVAVADKSLSSVCERCGGRFDHDDVLCHGSATCAHGTNQLGVGVKRGAASEDDDPAVVRGLQAVKRPAGLALLGECLCRSVGCERGLRLAE